MFLDRHGHFFRTRTRHNVAVARRYLRGLAQAEDCTFESMAAVVEGGCPQQFQHFISCSPWDHEPVVAQIGQDADRLLGGKPTSALIIDESSFPKQGDCSVGVARQWTGRLGKIDNCQVAVFGVLTDGERHTPIDARLYLPERWIEDPARCERAGIPEAAREAFCARTAASIRLPSKRSRPAPSNWASSTARASPRFSPASRTTPRPGKAVPPRFSITPICLVPATTIERKSSCSLTPHSTNCTPSVFMAWPRDSGNSNTSPKRVASITPNGSDCCSNTN